jgi:hypothetical protein
MDRTRVILGRGRPVRTLETSLYRLRKTRVAPFLVATVYVWPSSDTVLVPSDVIRPLLYMVHSEVRASTGVKEIVSGRQATPGPTRTNEY